MALITSMTFFIGCNESRSMTEDEARSRAGDTIDDIFSKIHLDLEDYDGFAFMDEFNDWANVDESESEAIYDKNTDSYIIKFTNKSIRFSYVHPNPITGVITTYGDAIFNAEIKVYSSGEVHVDDFSYEVVQDD